MKYPTLFWSRRVRRLGSLATAYLGASLAMAGCESGLKDYSKSDVSDSDVETATNDTFQMPKPTPLALTITTAAALLKRQSGDDFIGRICVQFDRTAAAQGDKCGSNTVGELKFYVAAPGEQTVRVFASSTMYLEGMSRGTKVVEGDAAQYQYDVPIDGNSTTGRIVSISGAGWTFTFNVAVKGSEYELTVESVVTYN